MIPPCSARLHLVDDCRLRPGLLPCPRGQIDVGYGRGRRGVAFRPWNDLQDRPIVWTRSVDCRGLGKTPHPGSRGRRPAPADVRDFGDDDGDVCCSWIVRDLCARQWRTVRALSRLPRLKLFVLIAQQNGRWQTHLSVRQHLALLICYFRPECRYLIAWDASSSVALISFSEGRLRNRHLQHPRIQHSFPAD